MERYEVHFTKEAEYGLAILLRIKPFLRSKVNALTEALQIDPRRGIGKPEKLKNNLRGRWSRRIDKKHRLEYEIDDENLLVVCVRISDHYKDL